MQDRGGLAWHCTQLDKHKERSAEVLIDSGADLFVQNE
jgi:hypothetical protein